LSGDFDGQVGVHGLPSGRLLKVYVDWMHIGEAGNAAIARRIAGDITSAKAGAERRSPCNRRRLKLAGRRGVSPGRILLPGRSTP